jgi:hypothetical protein
MSFFLILLKTGLSKRMVYVARQVQKIATTKRNFAEHVTEKHQKLDELCELPSWVLLGEPGAGKTQCFKAEALACAGLYIRIVDFLYDDLTDTMKSKTLFLDGLDEIRAGGGEQSTLVKVRSRISSLGNPYFRIACRAADWYGSSDHEDISPVAHESEVLVFNLLPLREQDVIEILQVNFERNDAKAFVATAKCKGLDGLLTNPQTLQLLHAAVKGSKWPDTRKDVFELACANLVGEENKRHRDTTGNASIDAGKLLDGAGELFAIMLLSDKTGLALDKHSESVRFPHLDVFSLSADIASVVVRKAIFVQSASGQERLEPRHRSIAEYLAARWIAKQIDLKGMSLGRLLNLILGTDRRTVAGLRGLYGWLALLCDGASETLIQDDPLTVLLYGDVKPFPVEVKRRLLIALQKEVQCHPSVVQDLEGMPTLRTLFDPDLEPEFLNALSSESKNEESQPYAIFVLRALLNNSLSPRLIARVYSIVIDDSYWQSVRRVALEIWLDAIGTQQAGLDLALMLLDIVNAGKVSDPNDSLAGELLHHLFPAKIAASKILNYFHKPADGNYLGSYLYFWEYSLAEVLDGDTVGNDVRLILDDLCQRAYLFNSNVADSRVSIMTSKLLALGVTRYGDSVHDDVLLDWLSIGSDRYGDVSREDKFCADFSEWINARPSRYKGLLASCFKQCSGSASPTPCLYKKKKVLLGLEIPSDLGLWHLEQLQSKSHKDLEHEHLRGVMSALYFSRGAEGLSLEDVFLWAGTDASRLAQLKEYLTCDIPEWRKVPHKQKLLAMATKQERFQNLLPELEKIRLTQASPSLLSKLAGVWLGLYTDVVGVTPKARFDDYSSEGAAIYLAARDAFRACPSREGNPACTEIIELHLQKREYFMAKPCLVGMELRWEDGLQAIDELPQSTLEKMVCFRVAYGRNDVPDWFSYLALSEPDMVAKWLINFVTRCLAVNHDYTREIGVLAHHDAYEEVRPIAVPAILAGFPFRLESHQLQDLKTLLHCALHIQMEALPTLIENRLKLKSLDMPQRTYWLTAAACSDPLRWSDSLAGHVSGRWKRVELMTGFVGRKLPALNLNPRSMAHLLGALIEIQAPYAVTDKVNITNAPDHVSPLYFEFHHLVSVLSVQGSVESANEIERLLSLPILKEDYQLKRAFYETKQHIRENEFTFPPINQIVTILEHKQPVNTADLLVLALEALGEIARSIQTKSSNDYKPFWNQVGPAKATHKDEPSCRDALVPMLERRLQPFKIDCIEEGRAVNDKSADIRLSHEARIELPIEIKGEWHRELWSAADDQLIKKYTTAPKADGYGIYLVLWAGGEYQHNPQDGGKRATTAGELKTRLEETIPEAHRHKVKVYVMDVSWPAK